MLRKVSKMSDYNGWRCPVCGSCNTEITVKDDLEIFECLRCHHFVETEIEKVTERWSALSAVSDDAHGVSRTGAMLSEKRLNGRQWPHMRSYAVWCAAMRRRWSMAKRIMTNYPECFGEYSDWPCLRFGNKEPCPYIEACKNAKNKTVFMTKWCYEETNSKAQCV